VFLRINKRWKLYTRIPGRTLMVCQELMGEAI
jgi:hypothetical protein